MTKASFCTVKKALADRAPIFLLLDKAWADNPHFRELDRRCKGALATEAKRRRFRASRTEVVVQTHGAIPAPIVVLVNLENDAPLQRLFTIADRIHRIAREESTRRISVFAPEDMPVDDLRTLAEGVAMARHRFVEFKSHRHPAPPLNVAFAADRPAPAARRALKEAEIRARAVCLARDLSNTPAGALPPMALAERARELADDRLVVRIHDRAELEELGMGAILAVGQGSQHPPCLIELRYEPPDAQEGHIALVGKGITFDSGGLSIKPANAMEQMKRDMAGSATVIATIAAVAELGLPIRVRAYVPSAENMPDGKAVRPGDVITTFGGKTVEILNTDAEGRLVLADALAYALESEPRAILDYATLTGAVRVALGKRYAAVLGNDQGLIDRCLRASAASGEGLWQLPLAEEYRGELSSRIADLKNIGGEGGAGTITAALFLSEFVGDTPWRTSTSRAPSCRRATPVIRSGRAASAFAPPSASSATWRRALPEPRLPSHHELRTPRERLVAAPTPRSRHGPLASVSPASCADRPRNVRRIRSSRSERRRRRTPCVRSLDWAPGRNHRPDRSRPVGLRRAVRPSATPPCRR